MTITTTIRACLLAGAAFAAAHAAPALAQDDPNAEQSADSTTDDSDTQATDDDTLSTEGTQVIVTARRRAERLLDVPVAITAYSGQALEEAGAIDITDLSNTTPNVTFEVSRGTNSTLTAFIRGVGQQDPVAGFEAGIGLYLDDVYLNRPQAAVLDIYDVERIEVLRGPQGTLYGRNTIGGAVKYVTRRLGDQATVTAKGTYGSYNQADLVLSGSVPLGNGGLKLGGAFARLTRDGFGDNLTTGADNYNKDVWAARATLEYDGGEAVFARISGDYTHDLSNPRGGHRLIPGIASGTPVLDDVYDTRAGLVSPKQDVKAWGISGYVELHPASWATVRSITGVRKDDSATPIDFDSLAAVDLDVPAYYNNKQVSQELQLLVETGGLSALFGAYYLDADARTVFDVRLPGGVTATTFGKVGTQTEALFADATFAITPQLSISAGGRYTWDHRESQVLRRTYLGGGSPFFNGTGTLFATTSDFRGDADFKQFTPRASISYKITPDQNVYASYSKGFKGGGFDPRGQTTACRTPAGGTCNAQQVYDFMSFDPEKVSSYEIGYKASLFDRRLSLALAAFHADYTDVQIPGSVGTTVGGVQTFIGITTNAGKARINGVEFEGNAVLARDLGASGGALNFAWGVGYIDAKYKEFIDSRGINVADRRKFQNTPDWTASGTLGYSVPVASGSVTANTTVSYRSDSQQFELRTPMLDQKAYTLWDANLVWDINKTFSIGVHGRNLTDKRYITSGYNFLSQNADTGNFNRNATTGKYIPTLGAEGTLTAYYGSPRQVFVTGTVKF